eukprot:2619290-Pleurochrysis_carterae.AAC.1
MVSHFAFASHAYLRSARAPFPKLLEVRSRWPPLLCRATLLDPPHRRAQPRARASSQPPNSCIVVFLLAPARPGW